MGLINSVKNLLAKIWAWLEQLVASEANYLAEEKVKKAAKAKATQKVEEVAGKVEARVQAKVSSARATGKKKVTESLDGAA